MSTRKPTPSRRSLRPLAESLETRQLLSSLSTTPSATVSGTDIKGDRWTLTLYGPGTLNVVDQNGNAFTPATEVHARRHQHDHGFGNGDVREPAGGQGHLRSRGLRRHACFSSSLPSTIPAPTGTSTRTWSGPRSSTPQNGIAAVDMPNFWLGDTSWDSADRQSNFHSARGNSHSSWRVASMLPRESTPCASAAWTRRSLPTAERRWTRPIRTTSS